MDIQRDVHAALAGYLRAFATDRTWFALASVLPMGILFGAARVDARAFEEFDVRLSRGLAGRPGSAIGGNVSSEEPLKLP